MSTLEEVNALLQQKTEECKQAGELGQMLLARVDSITEEATSTQAALREEIQALKEDNAATVAKMNDIQAKNENLQSQNEECTRLLKEMEDENEGLLDEAGSKKGDASNHFRRVKAEMEVKCRELQDQVDLHRTEAAEARTEVDTLTKLKDRLKAEKDEMAGKLQELEATSSMMNDNLQQKDAELRSYKMSAGDEGEVRAMKEKNDGMFRDLEMMRKKINELQDVNNILTKQHEDDQTLLEDVKATNMMLREALETKELEWGDSNSNLASFAPKESLLGEIEQHFNRFQTFGSPQRGSSKMPNFMDVVKRDFENLAMRIHRLRQKMEKKWPDPPAAPGASPGYATPTPAPPNAAQVAPAAEPATAE